MDQQRLGDQALLADPVFHLICRTPRTLSIMRLEISPPRQVLDMLVMPFGPRVFSSMYVGGSAAASRLSANDTYYHLIPRDGTIKGPKLPGPTIAFLPGLAQVSTRHFRECNACLRMKGGLLCLNTF
jgi:hypothetical protein